jgi:hypothetical protein
VSVLHVTQIRSALTKLLDGKIDLSDLQPNASTQQREDAFVTRALAAYGIAISADVPPDIVASYVVDGYGDNGVDVIYFDPDDKRLYIGQSKFVKNGESGIALGDALKFLAGIRDLLNTDFAKFDKNKRVQALRNLVQQALEDASTRVTIVVSHTSVESVSNDIKVRVEELLSEVNDASEIIDFRELGQADIHASLSGQADGAPISLEAMIADWGQVREPYQAYYGQINAAELAAWYGTYGDRLFAKNIRKALGTTGPNKQIAETAREAPEHFWYFNNGVTVLCQAIDKKPLGGGGKNSAVLECRGVSIVNGAQTVASIHTANKSAADSIKRATVLIRFISLENCAPEFSTSVTRATNVQNRIEHRDFASLDPTQERLRRELLLEGKTYAYKTGDSPTSLDTACTMEEAAIALACSMPDVAAAVIAKSNIGRVWENLEASRSLYKRLFNDRVTGVQLWRMVELLRCVEECLRHEHRTRHDNRERMVAIHGNRHVAHEVFRRLDVKSTASSDCNIDALRNEVKKLVPILVPLVATAARNQFPKSYLQSLFKNATKCAAVSVAIKDLEASTRGSADTARPKKMLRPKKKEA